MARHDLYLCPVYLKCLEMLWNTLRPLTSMQNSSSDIFFLQKLGALVNRQQIELMGLSPFRAPSAETDCERTRKPDANTKASPLLSLPLESRGEPILPQQLASCLDVSFNLCYPAFQP